MYHDHLVASAHKILRLTFGILPIITGVDKFFNFLVVWDAYLAPEISALLPAAGLMQFFAVGEIIVGLLVLYPKTTKIGAWLVTLWLLSIVMQISYLGIYDIALRDLALALGAFTLVRLEMARLPARDASHGEAGGPKPGTGGQARRG